MAEPYIWGAMNRALNDPTTIDEAIADAIATHNDEPEAHLAADQSLETHRANDVIDHPAESVVNDKIAVPARTYVAIVDPNDDYSYDTIQGAVDYAMSVGGGTIFLAPGTHYLSGETEMSNAINIVGQDADTTFISGGYTAGNYLRIVDDLVTQQENLLFENITLETTGGAVIRIDNGDLSQESRLVFRFCSLLGGGEYLYLRNGQLLLEDCFIEANGTTAIIYFNNVEARHSEFRKISSGSSANFFNAADNGVPDKPNRLEQCTIDLTGVSSGTLIGATAYPGWDLLYNRIFNFRTNPTSVSFGFVTGNYIEIGNSQIFRIEEGYLLTMIANNYFYCSGTGKVTTNGQIGYFVGNYNNGTYVDITTDLIIQAQADAYADLSYSTSTVALGMMRVRIASITANANKTLTTTVPPAGAVRTVRIRTNSTTSRTITFGSGFKSAGTLATGTANNREFIIRFESDGTSLWEISRTGALEV